MQVLCYSVCLFVYLFICLFVCLSLYLYVDFSGHAYLNNKEEENRMNTTQRVDVGTSQCAFVFFFSFFFFNIRPNKSEAMGNGIGAHEVCGTLNIILLFVREPNTYNSSRTSQISWMLHRIMYTWAFRSIFSIFWWWIGVENTKILSYATTIQLWILFIRYKSLFFL